METNIQIFVPRKEKTTLSNHTVRLMKGTVVRLVGNSKTTQTRVLCIYVIISIIYSGKNLERFMCFLIAVTIYI